MARVLVMLILGLLAACTVIGVTILCCSSNTNNCFGKKPKSFKKPNIFTDITKFHALITQPLTREESKIAKLTSDF